MEGDDDAPAAVKPPREDSTEGPPAEVSDNPLDAPPAPRPEADEGEADEDEEMGGTEGDKKADANGTTEGDGTNEDAQAQAKTTIEASARSHLIAQTHAIILPSYSTWFDLHDINAIEKKALPEFFNSRNRSKTPAVYKDYRDFMINTYRLNPAEYLTVTACRRNLAGDVCAIMRVHAFLEQWGLINYQVDPDARPSNIQPPFTGHFKITADTPRGLQPHQPAPGSVVTQGKPYPPTERLANAAPPTKADLNLQVRRNIYESSGKDVTPASLNGGANGDANATNGAADQRPLSAKELEELLNDPGKTFHCMQCGTDCTRVRFHYAKGTPVPAQGKPSSETKHDLCTTCFKEKKYPQACLASDYTKLENPRYSTIPDRDAPWTDSELLLLLEALEMFDDDWNRVADHVTTRSREECILKFLQLEIEDQYLDAELGVRIPFTQSDNPIMSVLGFLASLANPNVTAAAAHRSVEEMKRTLLSRLEKGDKPAEEGTSKEKAPAGEPSAEASGVDTVKHEDAMEVDTAEPSDVVASSKAPSQPQPDLGNPITTMPFALAAGRSGGLASHEERKLTHLVSAATNIQLQKLELKLQQFDELEGWVTSEKRDVERKRQELFLERLAFMQRMREVEETFAKALTLVSPVAGMDGTGAMNGGAVGGTATQTQPAVDQVVEAAKMVKEALETGPGKPGGIGRLAVTKKGKSSLAPPEASEGWRGFEL
ncbi:SWIRM-domain-containing protein [Eremomyces bilateralis CBS 781.70]|uniref:SWIRM-domain-containing protein n=1 Tax=Eremomyces bilateralis CBS 781.70 TaxID=1392243 RepID=A0A6G1G0I6_9PEZI|nr:SWIRM-domain-containing protein [Eremomyces bilateralis CBS 781.70]KAF1811564.1 SWIRM-domain-containing protein [Eremomyces bilateralis CBS 781.70]